MHSVGRRDFIQQLGKLGTLAAAGSFAGSQALASGPGERVVVGVIGCGVQGSNLAGKFAALADVKVAYACDPDQERAQKTRQSVGADQAVSDLRKVLDDKAVDAVVIATPDHWHAPAAILACQAGKHVYVEKPCSHNFRESQLLLRAARVRRWRALPAGRTAP